MRQFIPLILLQSLHHYSWTDKLLLLLIEHLRIKALKCIAHQMSRLNDAKVEIFKCVLELGFYKLV